MPGGFKGTLPSPRENFFVVYMDIRDLQYDVFSFLNLAHVDLGFKNGPKIKNK